jgi:hypothetical protein
MIYTGPPWLFPVRFQLNGRHVAAAQRSVVLPGRNCVAAGGFSAARCACAAFESAAALTGNQRERDLTLRRAAEAGESAQSSRYLPRPGGLA